LRKIESSSEHSRLKFVLIPLALLAYPALIHFSFAFDKPLLVTSAWLAISAVGLVVAIRRGLTSLSSFFAVLLAVGGALWWLGSAVDLIFVPPVLVNIALMTLFGRSLLPGATPLVARVASLFRGTLDREVAQYTRRVTIAWTIFFALMVMESVALALFAPLHVWSLFTNFVNYVLILLFFVIEHRLRLRCLPRHEHLSFRAFCHLVASTDLRSLTR